MLPIGEDLVIPQAIIDSMMQLGVCGTRILTWQRTGSGGLDFVPFPLYPVGTITHLASHDTATLAQWWKKYYKAAEEYSLWKGWDHTFSLDSKKRFEFLYDSHHTSSLFHANLLQEYLALFPELVHKNQNEERINYPGTPSQNNWRYRFIPSVEEISTHRKLSDVFKKILA
jgi:4-alpha-glucanotransferase